jgi:hypothetical protein
MPSIDVVFSFKKTKSMSALLEERSKRKNDRAEARTGAQISKNETRQSLASLVESVKRKRAVIDNGDAKRQKL